ncbi:MAG: P4 alpha zinc-binding domain protein, partial [Candidatus Gallionella acididurans]
WSEGIKAGIKLPEEDIPQGMKSLDWLDALNGSVHQAPAQKTVSR